MNTSPATAFSTIPTFDHDEISLLSTLGLLTSDLELSKETLLGHVRLPNEVDISVCATSTPALFFRFDFRFPDNRQLRATTGSGSFQTYWQQAIEFAETQIDPHDEMFQLEELNYDLSERCSRCSTTFQFKVAKEQAVNYLPPRTKLVQHIFPEIPTAARAVLAQSHICGVCLYQDDIEQQEIARAYICHDAF